MKRIDKLTEEQRAQMKPWVDKWVEIGLRTGDADWDTFDKYMPICYEKAGIPYPKNVVRVSSPMVGALASAIAREFLKSDSAHTAVRTQVGSAVDSAVGSAVYSAVDSEVGTEIGSAVDSQISLAVDRSVESAVRSEIESAVVQAVRSEVYSAVESEVDSEVGSAVESRVRSAVGLRVESMINSEVASTVDSAVDTAVHSAVDSQVGSAIYSEVDSAVRSAARSEVESAVRSEIESAVVQAVRSAVVQAVRAQVRSAIDSAVGSAVRSEVESAVHSAVQSAVDSAIELEVDSAVQSAVDSAIDSAVGSAVNSEVESQLRSAVDSEVGLEVESAVHSEIISAVRSAVRSRVDSAVGLAIRNMEWHPWLGGQFWVGGWWGSPSFVSFFTDVCGLELEQDIQERATAYRKVCESVNYIWPNRNFVMVCDRPKEIHRDENGQLHNENGLAIRYGDGWGLYMWHGIKVPDWLITTRAEDLTVDEYVSLESADQKIAFIEKAGINCLISKGKLIDSYKNYLDTEFAERFPIEVSEYELYDMSSIFDGDDRAVYLSMNHLSTGAKVFECVDNNRTLPEALAYRLNLPVSVVNEVRVTDAV